MAMRKKLPLELGKRERQVYETVVTLGEASVHDVLRQLDDPPSYSAVRATLNLLVDKKWLRYRQMGQRYLYRASGGDKIRKTAVERMLSTFFGGSALDAMAALLDASASQLSQQELDDMMELIEKKRQEKNHD